LKTQKAITKLGWTVLPHPPYSPDLAPPDLHLFRALKDVTEEVAADAGFRLVQDGETCSFLAGAMLLKLTEIM
jgi:hypothetical protein